MGTITNDAENLLYEKLFPYKGVYEKKLSSMKNSFYIQLAEISQEVINRVVQKGYYAKNPNIVRGTYIAIGTLVAFAAFFMAMSSTVIFATFFCAILIIIFGYFMPRRTKKGAIAREQILGLKMYMNTAEKDRINFHNAPEKKPERFEKLLPYAMALGVEKAWASQFEDMYNSKPDWYEGSEAFGAGAFANEMSSLGKSTASTMKSQPSSASSGSSGFSGGGSGGGFGGGGGGSW